MAAVRAGSGTPSLVGCGPANKARALFLRRNWTRGRNSYRPRGEPSGGDFGGIKDAERALLFSIAVASTKCCHSDSDALGRFSAFGL